MFGFGKKARGIQGEIADDVRLRYDANFFDGQALDRSADTVHGLLRNLMIQAEANKRDTYGGFFRLIELMEENNRLQTEILEELRAQRTVPVKRAA